MGKISTELVEDDRSIQAIYPARGGGYEVGEDGVTKIEAYNENGERAPVPWVAVYKGDEIVVRSHAAKWTIHYE